MPEEPSHALNNLPTRQDNSGYLITSCDGLLCGRPGVPEEPPQDPQARITFDQAGDGGGQIRLIGLMVLLTTPVAFIYHAAMHAMFPGTFSLPTFLFIPNVRFTDFYEPYLDAQLYGPPSNTNTVYSPLVHVFMTALTHIPDFVALTLVVAVFGASLALLTWHGVTARVGSRRLRWAYVLIFCFLSYPVLFLVDRANLETLRAGEDGGPTRWTLQTDTEISAAPMKVRRASREIVANFSSSQNSGFTTRDLGIFTLFPRPRSSQFPPPRGPGSAYCTVPGH